MSRYIKILKDGDDDYVKWVAYGYDRMALGYFFEVAESTKGEDDVTIIDQSSALTKMSRAMMIELMTIYELPESHIEAVASNIGF